MQITIYLNIIFKKMRYLAVIPFLALNISAEAALQVTNSKQRDKPVVSTISAPDINAKAWAIMEMNSGWVVAHHNGREPRPPASITKLMMNYVIFSKLKSGDIKFSDEVSISEKAWSAIGSRMFADVNTRIDLKHLLKSTIIQSGNDAAIALAEYVGGSELGFSQLMNQEAERLGLLDTHYVNSTGLTAQGHDMSAIDVLALSAAIIRDYPDYYPWYAEKEYEHNNIKQPNRNKLLWKDSSVDGLKTGYTEAAGYCLVGSAKRNGQRWIAVVLGTGGVKEREDAVLSLLNYAFAAYQPLELLDKQGGLVSAPVYGGEVDEVRLQAINSIDIVVPKGRASDVITDLQFSPYFEAPIEVGQTMGVVNISLDGKLIADVPLVATSSIKSGGWWKRFKDSIRLKFK